MFYIFAVILPLVVLAFLLVSIVTYYKLWRDFKLPRLIYWLIQAILIALFVVCLVFSGNTSGFLHKAMLFYSAAYFVVIIYSSVIFILSAVISLLAGKFSPTSKFSRLIKHKKILPLATLCLTLVLSVSGYINMGILCEKDINIELDEASTNDSLTAVMISDTHLGTGLLSDKLDDLVDSINSMEPDVIFMVGDIIDESTSNADISTMIAEFSRLESRYGTFFVYGNHEYYISSPEVDSYFEQAGITVLRDEAVTIADDITIIGRKSYYENPMPVEEIIEENNIDESNPIIVLAHEPLGLEDLSLTGADLSFSGHTHGEQFPLIYSFMAIANDMVYGIAQFNDMTAYTSSGAGGWGMHFKLPSNSEIVKAQMTFNS
ncbi:MAG: metallophosphoesterase [Ruminococcus sp.]|nr:metallophosphoesterase [Ruminococcus sp.]